MGLWTVGNVLQHKSPQIKWRRCEWSLSVHQTAYLTIFAMSNPFSLSWEPYDRDKADYTHTRSLIKCESQDASDTILLWVIIPSTHALWIRSTVWGLGHHQVSLNTFVSHFFFCSETHSLCVSFFQYLSIVTAALSFLQNPQRPFNKCERETCLSPLPCFWEWGNEWLASCITH